MAVDSLGNLIIADGRRIRKVLKSDGKIVNLAGSYKINEWQPQNRCSKSAKEAPLNWPTSLAINPHDQTSIYFVDGDEILMLRYGQIILPRACYR